MNNIITKPKQFSNCSDLKCEIKVLFGWKNIITHYSLPYNSFPIT